MCVNARRAAKLTLLVSDLQNTLEEHMKDLWIEDDYICGYWTDKEFYQMRLRLNLMRQ